MLKKVAIIIPFYKEKLTVYETISLIQFQKILGNHPLIAVKPSKLVLPKEVLELDIYAIKSFDNSFFENIAGYNRLMLSPAFYTEFFEFEYILIYQLDAFVFHDQLLYWCAQDLDYIGAPWIRKSLSKSRFKKAILNFQQQVSTRFNLKKNNLPNKYQFENKVGNGGFSLRRVKKFHDLTLSMDDLIGVYLTSNEDRYNEDAFWSIEVNRKQPILKIPHYLQALKFSFDVNPNNAYILNNEQLPFGCHDWDTYLDFWRPFFKEQQHQI